jgi:hypothetical protein
MRRTIRFGFRTRWNVGAGKTVFFPAGKYRIQHWLKVWEGTRLEGSGDLSIIRAKNPTVGGFVGGPSGTGAMLEFGCGLDSEEDPELQPSLTGEIRCLRIEGGTFASGVYTPIAATGVYFHGSNWLFEDVWIRNVTGTALILDRAQNSVFLDCQFSRAPTVLKIANGTEWCLFLRCEIADATVNHLLVDSVEGLLGYEPDSEDPEEPSEENVSVGVSFQTCVFETSLDSTVEYLARIRAAIRFRFAGCQVVGGVEAESEDPGPSLGLMSFENVGASAALRNNYHVLESCNLALGEDTGSVGINNESKGLVIENTFFQTGGNDPPRTLVNSSNVIGWSGSTADDPNAIVEMVGSVYNLQFVADRITGTTAQRPDYGAYGVRSMYWDSELGLPFPGPTRSSATAL